MDTQKNTTLLRKIFNLKSIDEPTNDLLQDAFNYRQAEHLKALKKHTKDAVYLRMHNAMSEEKFTDVINTFYSGYKSQIKILNMSLFDKDLEDND